MDAGRSDVAPVATIGIICGMASEVRTLGRWAAHPDVSVTVSGARPARATELAERLAADGARVLVSWGIAGGLDPVLPAGALMVPDMVVLPDGTRVRLAVDLLDGGASGTLAGSDRVVTSVEGKADLARRTGAAAVDMETHRVAEVAARRAVPCLAVRAVSDPASRALPALAASALDADGQPRIGHVLRGLAGRPWDLPDLIRAGRDSRQALKVLSDAADGVLAELLSGQGPRPA